MGKRPERITVLHRVAGGWAAHEVLSPEDDGPRRPPRWARAMLDARGREIAARKVFWTELERRRERSDEKRAWGSVVDAPKNRVRALRKAVRAYVTDDD